MSTDLDAVRTAQKDQLDLGPTLNHLRDLARKHGWEVSYPPTGGVKFDLFDFHISLTYDWRENDSMAFSALSGAELSGGWNESRYPIESLHRSARRKGQRVESWVTEYGKQAK